MFLTRVCLRNPVAVTLLYVLIGLAGVVALARIGRSILPPVAFPVVAVTAPYPGASATEMERLVLEPIEDQLEQLPDLDRVSASAQDGVALITVRFRFGSDLAAARANVQQAVNAAQPNLPPDAIPPVVSRDDLGQAPVLEEAVSSAVLSPAALSAAVERIVVPALRATAGVGVVLPAGELTRQLTVEPRMGRLNALGATPLDLVRAVAKSNDVLPGGTFRTPLAQAPVGIRAVALSPAALAAFPFAFPGGSAAVRIGDVATVRDGFADQDVLARVDGMPAITIDVGNARSADGLRTIHAARKTFARLAKELPLIRFEQLRSDEPYTNAATAGVLQTLGEGVLLTVLVMFAFLRAWRNAAIAAIAIPSSLCAAFATMWALGLTVNVLSLMGLSLTIGILVDDSIVIVEAIAHSAARGLAGDDAALAGRRELGGAVYAITLVDVAVFAPIALMSGIVGEFMREFGLVVVIATAFSLFVSFTLTPLLAARWALLRPGVPAAEASFGTTFAPLRAGAATLPWTLRSAPVLRAGAAWRSAIDGFTVWEERVRVRYARRWLPYALAHRGVVISLAAIACAASLAPVVLGGIPTEFSPPVNRGEVRLELTFPPGATLEHVDAGVARIAQRLLDEVDVKHVVTNAGRSFDGGGEVFASNRAEIAVVLADASASGSAVLGRIRSWRALVPDATIAGAGTGMGGRPPVSYNLTGAPVALAIAARRIAGLLDANPLATDVRTSDAGLAPRLDIEIDPARALLLNVAPDDAAQTARIATGGIVATKVRLPSGLVDVAVRGEAARSGDLDQLRRVSVRSADARLVPLAAVATFRTHAAPAVIRREDRARVVTVSANTVDGAPIGLVTAPVAAALRTAGFLPDGVQIAARGDIEQFLDTLARIVAALGLSVVVVYAILAVLYRSYVLPLVVMATVPLAAVGAFGSLYAMNVAHTIVPNVALFGSQTLNLYSMLGVVMLVGLVTKNGILLVEYAEREVRSGADPVTAMCSAAERRLRPILMTTLAMIAGMLPLALGDTIGAEYRKALGTVVIGGLSSSLLLTMFVVPLVYTAFRATRPVSGPRSTPRAPRSRTRSTRRTAARTTAMGACGSRTP